GKKWTVFNPPSRTNHTIPTHARAFFLTVVKVFYFSTRCVYVPGMYVCVYARVCLFRYNMFGDERNALLWCEQLSLLLLWVILLLVLTNKRALLGLRMMELFSYYFQLCLPCQLIFLCFHVFFFIHSHGGLM
ncbi:unnamed protein product, partial [Pylaiella littoralis]